MSNGQLDILRVRCLLCNKIIECSRADTSVLVYHIRNAHPEVTLQSSDELNGAPRQEFVSEPLHQLYPIQQKKQRNDGERLKDAQENRLSSGQSEINEVQDVKKVDEDIGNAKQPNIEDTILSVNPVEIPGFGIKRTSFSEENIKEHSVHHESFVTAKISKLAVRNPSSKSISPAKPIDKDTKILFKRQYKFKEPLPFRRPGKRKLYKTSIEKWRPGRSTIVCPECGANKRPMIKSQVDKVSHSPFGAAFILTCWPFCFLPCLFPPPTKEYLHCAVCNHFLGVYDRKTEIINPNEHSLKRSAVASKASTAAQPELSKT